MDVLKHQAEESAQLVEIQLPHVDAVDGNPTALDVVKTQQQIDEVLVLIKKALEELEPKAAEADKVDTMDAHKESNGDL